MSLVLSAAIFETYFKIDRYDREIFHCPTAYSIEALQIKIVLLKCMFLFKNHYLGQSLASAKKYH